MTSRKKAIVGLKQVKKCFNEITKLGKIVQALPEVNAEQMRKGIAEASGMETEPKVLIAGGENESGYLNSVEMFKLSNVTWTTLQPLRKCSCAQSSVVYNHYWFVFGGYASSSGIKSIERLSLNAVHVNLSISWKVLAGQLPSPFYGHHSVVYNGQVIIIGGYDGDKHAVTDSITEVSLVPPYTSKLLTTMPQRR